MKVKEQRESFIFYASFEEAINEIEDSDKETKLAIYRAIVRYSLYREQPKLKGVANMAWKLICPMLDKQWTNYFNGCKGADFGKMGGAPKGNKNAAKQPPNNPQTTPYIDKDKNINTNTNISHLTIEEFGFAEDFDLSGLPIEKVLKWFNGILAAHPCKGNIRAYFDTIWSKRKGECVDSYNRENALVEDRRLQAEANQQRKERADDPNTFVNWAKLRGYDLEAMREVEKNELFKRFRSEGMVANAKEVASGINLEQHGVSGGWKPMAV